MAVMPITSKDLILEVVGDREVVIRTTTTGIIIDITMMMDTNGATNAVVEEAEAEVVEATKMGIIRNTTNKKVRTIEIIQISSKMSRL